MTSHFSARWRQLRESPDGRLTEHFFHSMFDFGFLNEPGADSFKRVVVGSVGGVVAVGLVLTRGYMIKYAGLWQAGSPERYRVALAGDDMLIIALPMLLVAFITLLVSQSLFPDERDFRILGPMPLRRTVVFRAKLAAVFLFTGLFTAAAHASLIPLMLLTSMNPWGEHNVLSRVLAWVIAGVGGSVFAVLAITAVVGVLGLALSRGGLHTLSAMMRSAVLAGLVVCLPLVSRLPVVGGSLLDGPGWTTYLPPAWFLGLHRVLQGNADPALVRLAAMSLAAVAIAVLLVAAIYTVLFRRFERLMLRPASMSRPWFRMPRVVSLPGATPAYRGVHAFTVTTLVRSQLHQGVLVGVAAVGVGFLIGLLGARFRNMPLLAPFVLMYLCGIAARAALVLPMEYKANWIFQLTEDQTTRRDQLRAVDRVVTRFVVGLPVLVAMPVLWWTRPADAAMVIAVLALVGLVFVHAVLHEWRRIPFTCSYLPGKRFIGHSVIFGFFFGLLFTVFGGLLAAAAATGTPPVAVIVVATLSTLAFVLRRQRLALWRDSPLMFEDELPDQPQLLELQR
jgi:hypothetical protein